MTSAADARLLSTLLVFLLALTVTTPSASAQNDAASLEPALTEGARFTHDLSLDLVVSQDLRLTRIVQGARLVFVVEDVDRDGATVRATIDRLTNVYTERVGEEAAERQVEFAWRRADDPDLERATSADEAFATLNRTLAGSTLRFAVDRDGNVTRVAGLATTLELLGPDTGANLSPAMLGIFAPTQFERTISPIFSADTLVEGPRRAGDGWQTTAVTPAGPAGAIEFIHDWRVEEIGEEAVRYAGRERVTVLRPDNLDSAAPSVRIAEHAGRIEGVWSREAGVLDERTVRRRMSMVWTLGEQSLTQTQSVDLTISRVESVE